MLNNEESNVVENNISTISTLDVCGNLCNNNEWKWTE